MNQQELAVPAKKIQVVACADPAIRDRIRQFLPDAVCIDADSFVAQNFNRLVAGGFMPVFEDQTLTMRKVLMVMDMPYASENIVDGETVFDDDKAKVDVSVDGTVTFMTEDDRYSEEPVSAMSEDGLGVLRDAGLPDAEPTRAPADVDLKAVVDRFMHVPPKTGSWMMWGTPSDGKTAKMGRA